MRNGIKLLGRVTLKELRRIAGLSILEMSSEIGISERKYKAYEEHPEKMTVGDMFRICDVFGISVRMLKIPYEKMSRLDSDTRRRF